MDIKFRGKLKAIGQEGDGEWVFGDLLTNKGCSYIVPEYADIEHMDEDIWEIQGLLPVDSASVGMWTGQKDKNGKEIFGEGDIYKDADGIISVVEMAVDGWALFPITEGTPVRNLYWQNVYDKTKGEVIGNVTDNPELIKD